MLTLVIIWRLWVPLDIKCEILPDMGHFPWKLEQRGGIVFRAKDFTNSMKNYGYVTDIYQRDYNILTTPPAEKVYLKKLIDESIAHNISSRRSKTNQALSASQIVDKDAVRRLKEVLMYYYLGCPANELSGIDCPSNHKAKEGLALLDAAGGE